MIARITRGQSGLAKYILDGRRKDSEYSRDEKDHVLPLYGDLDIFKKTEKFLNENKDYQDNYLHITLSLNKEDLERLNAADDKESIYRDMVETYIKHHTSGYDLDNEVIAYAEAHIPKIKEEHDKERLEHIHIAIALYNPLDDTKLRTTFAENDFIDNALQEYVNRKNGLTNPHQFKRERDGINADTNTARNRKYYINELKDIQNKDELLEYLKSNNMEYREVKTAKNHYFKIITPGDHKDINLRGKGFEHLSDIAQGKEIASNKNRAVEELENILGNYYKKRIDQIHGRRSAASKEMIESIYDDKELLKKEPGENVIYPSFKQKLFQKHYGKETKNKFVGYQIDLNAESGVKFTNKSKGIEVVDRGDKITGGNTGNVRDQAALMLDIAEAKGWPLNALGINGSEAFKKEVHQQIAERLKEREELLKVPEALEIHRPISEAEQLAAERIDEKKTEKLAEKIDLSAIKTQLDAATVLHYAINKYKLNAANYEITADNKINNLSNKQKPKNVIDFLQKEINLTGKESIEICEELFKNQPLKIQAVPIGTEDKLTTRKKDYEPTREQRAVALREPSAQSNARRKSNTANNLPVLSTSKLVSDIKSVELLLQNYDDADLHRRSEDINNRLRYTNARDDQVAGGSGSAISGDMKMSLKLSICKDTNLNALDQWETVEVANYTELATLMKQYPYSAAQFENGYRNLENAAGSGNILIYDIDNDKGNPQLSIAEARTLLEKQGISALILPSQSNNKEKPVRKSKASFEGETHVAERYRIIIPTADSLPDEMEKDAYREFQKLTAMSLGLDQYVDPVVLNNKAAFYYKSPIVAAPHVIKSNQVMKIDPFVQQAQLNLNARKAEAEKERQRIAQIRRNINKHRQTTGETASRYLTQADVDKLMSLQIAELIKHLEKAEEYKEGDYHMLKTDGAKYSVVEENVAHDFKNEVTYNNITFLQKHYKTENLNAIAKELEKETGESYIKTNVEEVQRAIEEAMRDAVNDKALEEVLKERFTVKYCKLDAQNDTIIIADREINLHEINQNKEQLIKQFRENREQEVQRKQRKGPSLSL